MSPELYRIEFILHGLPSLQRQVWSHWTKVRRERDQWRDLIAVVTARQRPAKPLQKADVFFTRFSSAEPDYTNMVASYKPIEDALVKLGILRDDSPQVIVSREYAWERAPRGGGYIKVEIQEIST